MSANVTITFGLFLLTHFFQSCGKSEAEGTNETATTAGVSTEIGSESTAQPLSNCKASERPVFTAHVTDLDKIAAVTPLGGVGGGGTEIVGRSYVFPKGSIRNSGEAVPIYAPVDMELKASIKYIPPGAAADYQPDWALAFEVNCDVTVSFAHIKFVDPAIDATWPGAASEHSGPVEVKKRIPFKAGEKIGEWVGSAHAVAFDYIVEDKSSSAVYANQARYVNNSWRFQKCPYDYYPETMKVQWYAKLGNSTQPIAGTKCGGPSADVPGTLAGEWFWDQTASNGMGEITMQGAFGNPLPLASDALGVLTVGHIGSLQGMRFYGVDRPENISMRNGAHCYEMAQNIGLPQGYVYLKFVADDHIKVNYSATEACPVNFPEAGSKDYYR